ncbi:MAG: effector-associated domain EAD1-containing protein [Anaerolineae bacterium]|nr:effector-associated domain EAD1-containing protein [Anaerolineae bacterium]
MRLTGKQHQQLVDALLDGFELSSFAQMVRAYLDVRLDKIIASNDNFETVVSKTVGWAEKSDRVNDLIAGAKTANPTNRAIENLPDSYDQPTSQPSNQQTTLIANAPYGLDSAIVGREDELALLDDWYLHDIQHPLLAVIGLGGMGKSALTWHWIQRLQADGHAPPLIVWWAFYETDGTPDKLMADVLTHFGDDPKQFASLRQAINRFMQHLRRTKALVVLDGAERLLRAYHGMGAAYQGDDEQTADPHVRARARECVDPVVGVLLQWLADPTLTQAKTVVTSRLFPLELAGRGGTGLRGVRRHDLTGLSNEATYHLFRGLGVQATRADVRAVCEPLGYHPLSLHLLARYVAYDPQAPNDLRAAVDYDPVPDMLGKRTQVLQRAYDNLPQRIRLLLSRLAALRSSATWDVISAITDNDKHLRDDLAFLEKRGLIQRTVHAKESALSSRPSSLSTSYDLHPIVRKYAYARLANPAATHAQLASYFNDVPRPEQVRSIADLQPTIELYHHLVRAKKFDEAWVLFRDRLWHKVYYQLGQYQLQIECLLALFSKGSKHLPDLSDESHQAHACNELANSYSLSGQPAAAIPLFEQHNAIREKQDDNRNLAVGLGNLASRYREVGALAGAAENLRRSIALCRESEDRFSEAVGHRDLGRLLASTGEWAAVAEALDTALELFSAENHLQMHGVTWAGRAEAALLQGQADTAAEAAREAYQIATSRRNERDRIRSEWLMGWAALAQQQFDDAQHHLDTALRRCRAINMVDHEPKILLAHARLAAVRSEPQQALDFLQEAQTIAERAGYVLDLADIHNLRAQRARDSGDHTLARRHAQAARDYAWCDGPPYAYQVALDEAERLLGIL